MKYFLFLVCTSLCVFAQAQKVAVGSAAATMTLRLQPPALFEKTGNPLHPFLVQAPVRWSCVREQRGRHRAAIPAAFSRIRAGELLTLSRP
ncbi:hypothetical protein EPD60_15135 [Flaviaesturariibacter flavus]|uniref:Uncharacterized protein n=1 Tax=Flaviaesturariibacter flavus TaxID=2502780 RepID=A0A4R1B540_9BACT|nr:hypothetical protein [Flaviaesturariibacter flavus]TCJ12600.1 hypothetical protein EPD60_15135 [Flaviaesturariibacter flavus]